MRRNSGDCQVCQPGVVAVPGTITRKAASWDGCSRNGGPIGCGVVDPFSRCSTIPREPAQRRLAAALAASAFCKV